MLLNMKKVLFITLTVLISTSVNAQNADFLSAGKYTLVSGDKNLCPNFDLSKEDFKGRSITIAGFYNFNLKNSKHLVESDIDANCQFKETNTVEHKDDLSALSRTNEEFCSKQLRSKTISTLEVKKQDIKLQHQVDGAEVKCHWKK